MRQLKDSSWRRLAQSERANPTGALKENQLARLARQLNFPSGRTDGAMAQKIQGTRSTERKMDNWTTRFDPEFLRPYGVEELHTLCFEPQGWPGHGNTITLGIPECELSFIWCDPAGDPAAVVNQPRFNRNVKCWTRTACEAAADFKAFLIIACDTSEQAAIAARRVAKLLPGYRRMALERLYCPEDRARDRLS